MGGYPFCNYLLVTGDAEGGNVVSAKMLRNCKAQGLLRNCKAQGPRGWMDWTGNANSWGQKSKEGRRYGEASVKNSKGIQYGLFWGALLDLWLVSSEIQMMISFFVLQQIIKVFIIHYKKLWWWWLYKYQRLTPKNECRQLTSLRMNGWQCSPRGDLSPNNHKSIHPARVACHHTP